MRGPTESTKHLTRCGEPSDEVAPLELSYVGKLFDPRTGQIRSTCALVTVFGNSRRMYVDQVVDHPIDAGLKLHVDSSEYLQGAPKILVPESAEAAVTRAFFGLKDSSEFNQSYREFGRRQGYIFAPRTPYVR